MNIQTKAIETTGIINEKNELIIDEPLPSSLRLHRLMTVASSLIKRELGRLSARMEQEVDIKLSELFSLKVTR
jgi:hypothetical protein